MNKLNYLEYYEFIFAGKNNEDLHGISLREEIREIASKMREKGIEINGIVKNLKREGKVKVNCLVKSNAEANEFFNSILSIRNPLIKDKIDNKKSAKTRIGYEPIENAPQFNGFQIEREDELSEMVWALQGAGRLFGSQEEIREQKRKKVLSEALKHNLTDVSATAEELRVNRKAKNFALLAIDNYLKECPTEDNNLMLKLYELRHFCEKSNALMPTERTEEQEKEFEETLKKIFGLVPEIENSFGKK